MTRAYGNGSFGNGSLDRLGERCSWIRQALLYVLRIKCCPRHNAGCATAQRTSRTTILVHNYERSVASEILKQTPSFCKRDHYRLYKFPRCFCFCCGSAMNFLLWNHGILGLSACQPWADAIQFFVFTFVGSLSKKWKDDWNSVFRGLPYGFSFFPFCFLFLLNLDLILF